MGLDEHPDGCTCPAHMLLRGEADQDLWKELVGGASGAHNPLVLVSAGFTRGSMMSLANGLEIPATVLTITGRPPDSLADDETNVSFTVALNNTQMLYLSLMFLTEYGKQVLPDTPEEAPDGG